MTGRELLADRYELRGILGRGGMAEVHDGWDTRLHRTVAVKLLNAACSADAGLRRRFTDEARAAAALSHPNIVAVHDFGEHHGTPFLVMERLPGGTLADEMARGPMSTQRLRAILTEVLGALGAAHAAGVLHRDVKPGNILIAPGGAAKLADFGIAKTAGAPHTATGQIMGTLAYLSPQRVAGAPASAADDLYAVGVTAYEALAARPLFSHENPAALIHAILTASPAPIGAVRPDVDPGLAAVIDRAMAREPGLRFGDAGQMRAALAGVRALTGVAHGPRPATKVLAEPLAPSANYYVPAPPPRPMTRERKLLLAAAAAVVLVIAVLALAVDQSSTTRTPQQVGTSTAVPSPPPATTLAPPPSSAPPTFEVPPPARKKPGNGRGGGRGNGNDDD